MLGAGRSPLSLITGHVSIGDYVGFFIESRYYESIELDNFFELIGELLKNVEPEDLLKFGLIPEFIGRVPVLATLEDLDEDTLVKILTEPKNALVKQYQRLFEMEDVQLTFSEESLSVISRRAIERKTGARGLRSIMEGILLETMFELPGFKGIEEIVISPEVVEGSARPLRIYSERAEEIESSA